MYILDDDFEYMETLLRGLDDGRRKRFQDILVRETAGRAGSKNFGKIKIVAGPPGETANPRW